MGWGGGSALTNMYIPDLVDSQIDDDDDVMMI